ncbi:MAG: marine proteobacterial sortase target protein [Gammaproteobacteria bacterium]|nr:marine proteobacterial sortase target protein [Gammaproteobacteria bacterium]MBU2677073.1 marine proteobacterial sortase target protein [Gammaproteobacteria bacterium]NNL50804.1 marine proteobacterial sortase target protein [Woeseiaceae bacterium]
MNNFNTSIRVRIAQLVLLLIGPVMVLAEEPLPSQAQAGSLLWRMQQGYTTATLMNTEVDMQISGLVARVSVRQEFLNEGAEWVEGIYVFPLPDRAAVDRMRLHIGDRFIEGEIEEKERARKTYEQAKQAGKKTSLVQQQRANLFTTSVANVAPGERVVVEIEYLEEIRYEEGRFSIRFPMTLTPRYISGQSMPDKLGSGWSADTDRVPDASLITPPMVSSSKGHKLALAANVNAGMPLAIITSRYHPVDVAEHDGRYTVTLGGGQVPMDHDFELVWQPVASAAPRAMIFSETIEGEPHHLLMVMPPDQDEAPPVLMPREVILIIDTSGSMHGVSIAQAKRAVSLALEGLQPTDRFNVIEFNSTTNALYPESVMASSSSVDSAKKFVQQLRANGGTEMRPALSMALNNESRETHLRQIVFITDGSVGYEDEMFSMIEDRLGDARLFTVGIGSAPNSWFMRQAAEAGRGSFTFISALHEVREKMDGLFRKLEHPQVTGITVDWPSGVVVDGYPQTVPDLYLGEPVTVKARASGEYRAGDTVRVSGDSVTGGWSKALPLDSSQSDEGVGALWARARIADLMHNERRHSEPDETRAAIVATAMRHHLVSKYTSLVAVDKTPARPADDPLSSEQVPNLMPYGQSTNAIFGFPATATNAPMLRLIGIACLLAALLLFAALQAGQWRFRVRAA